MWAAYQTASETYFNPLPSCEGRREYSQLTSVIHRHFNPLPSCEGRPKALHLQPALEYFNPLPSCEGRPVRRAKDHLFTAFQSTPLMRGETLTTSMKFLQRIISIHSPHARGDAGTIPSLLISKNFNPLPSCEGRQHKPLKIRLDSRQFIQQNHHSSFF